VLVVVDGPAKQVGSVDGQTAGLSQVTATIHLDSDLVEVLDERVILGGEAPAPTTPDAPRATRRASEVVTQPAICP